MGKAAPAWGEPPDQIRGEKRVFKYTDSEKAVQESIQQ